MIKVISSLSAKSVEGSLVVMRKRLDKHFGMTSALVCLLNDMYLGCGAVFGTLI